MLQLPLSSVKPFYSNSISLPFFEVARIHVAVCHLKNSVAILEPLPVAYITWLAITTCSEVKCSLLELASIFVSVVVHGSAIAVL